MAALTHFIKTDATQRVTTSPSNTEQELTDYTISWANLTGAGFAAGDDVLILTGVKTHTAGVNEAAIFSVGFGTTFAGRVEDTTSMSRNEPVATTAGDQYLWFDRRTLVVNENIYFRGQTTASATPARYNAFVCLVIKLTDLAATSWFYSEASHAAEAPTSYNTSGAGAATGAAGDFLVFASCRFSVDDTTSDMFVAIHDGTADRSEVRTEGEDVGDLRVVSTVAYRAGLGAGVTLRARYRTDTANSHNIETSRIFGLRLNAFEDHAGAHTTNTITHSALDTFQEFAGFGTFGLSTTGPMVVIGWPIHTTNENSKQPYGRIQIGDVDWPVTDANRKSIADNGAASKIAPLLFGYNASQTAGTLNIDLDCAEDADVSPTYTCLEQVSAAFSLSLLVSGVVTADAATSGIATAAASGGVRLSRVITAPGVAAASAIGDELIVGSTIEIGAVRWLASWTPTAFVGVDGTAVGGGTATAKSAVVLSGLGAAAGAGTDLASGASTTATVGSSAAAGGSSVIGAGRVAATGSTAGAATADAFSTIVAAGVATAAGLGATSATTQLIKAAVCASTGVGTTFAIGEAPVSGNTIEIGAVRWVASFSPPMDAFADGSAAGSGTAAAVTQFTVAASGITAGTAAASAVASATIAVIGIAAGAGTASALGSSTGVWNFDQSDFRFYLDDGAGLGAEPIGPTPVVAVNVNPTLNSETTYLARARVENIGGVGGTSFKWQRNFNSIWADGTVFDDGLGFEEDGWTDITTTSSIVVAVNASSFADGADVPELLGGSGTYLTNNDAASEDGSVTLAAAFPSVGAVEFVLAFQIESDDVANGELVQLRLIEGNTPFATYTNLPIIEIVSAAVAAALIAAGTGAANAIGKSTISGIVASNGVADALAVSAADAVGVATSAGIGGGAATLAVTLAANGFVEGVGGATAQSASTNDVRALASGAAAAAATGAAIVPTIGSGAGSGTAIAVGGAGEAFEVLVTSAGTGAGAVNATAIQASTAVATGDSTAVGIGQGTVASLIGADGVASSVGGGSSIAAAIAETSGSSAATAAISDAPGIFSALGAAYGVGTAASIARAIVAAAGAASGEATAAATVTSDAAGTASGEATAGILATSIVPAIGTSAGVAAVNIAAKAIKGADGTTAGAAAASATSHILHDAIGTSEGLGTASAFGVGFAIAQSSGAGIGMALATSAAVAAVVGSSIGEATAGATAPPSFFDLEATISVSDGLTGSITVEAAISETIEVDDALTITAIAA